MASDDEDSELLMLLDQKDDELQKQLAESTKKTINLPGKKNNKSRVIITRKTLDGKISRISKSFKNNKKINDEDLLNNDIKMAFKEQELRSVSEKTPVVKPASKSSTTSPAKKEKKGPGRPRKTPKKEPMPVKGIVTEPKDADNVIELLYSVPLVFKKIISILKSLAVEQLQIIFRLDDVIFYAKSHDEKSEIRIKIDVTKLNSYYCKSVINIGVQRLDLDMLFNKIDRSYQNIIIISTTGNTQNNLTIIFEDEMNAHTTHLVDVHARYPHMTNEEEFINEDYLIKFRLTGKYFKKLINDIKVISPKICMKQDDNKSPLEFEYVSENKKIRSTHSIKNNKKIKLESGLAEDDTFRIEVKTECLRPISNTVAAENIWVLIDEDKKIMTKAVLGDGLVEIKTLTESIDKLNAT